MKRESLWCLCEWVFLENKVEEGLLLCRDKGGRRRRRVGWVDKDSCGSTYASGASFFASLLACKRGIRLNHRSARASQKQLESVHHKTATLSLSLFAHFIFFVSSIRRSSGKARSCPFGRLLRAACFAFGI